MSTDERVRQLRDQAVHQLIEAHSQRTDVALVLAVQFGLDDAFNARVLEVLDGFPGGDDDELLVTEFEPSAQLLILGKLYLTLGSPAQVNSAIARKSPELSEVKNGRSVYDNGSVQAKDLKRALGL